MSEQTVQTSGEKRDIKAKKGIGVRDLVTVAIFSVIYAVVFIIGASFGMIPVMAIFYPLPIALISGIPNMLFYTKAGKFGLVTIMGTLLGLLITLMGFGIHCLIGGIVCGLAADLIMRAGKYKSWKHILVGHVVFSLWPVVTSLQMWVMQSAYLEPFRATQGDAFVDQTMALLNVGTFIGMIVGVIVCAVVGAYLGRALLKKHFKRAGIV